MAYSFSENTGNGQIVTFPFAFSGPDYGYFDESEISVSVNGVDTEFTLSGPSQVTLAEAPAIGAKVLIYRKTLADNPYTDFERGNSFGKNNINRSFQKNL